MLRLLPFLMIMILASCNDGSGKPSAEINNNETSAEKISEPQKETARQGALKKGVYKAMQLSSAGFTYQYQFELMDGEYKYFDKMGQYAYDPNTEVIRFTTGGLKDFNGVFTRVPHVNEDRRLMIVIDFQGGIPDTLALGKKPGGYYQYAFYQEE